MSINGPAEYEDNEGAVHHDGPETDDQGDIAPSEYSNVQMFEEN